jgi:tetratricopeptide (TPR) repeat protein
MGELLEPGGETAPESGLGADGAAAAAVGLALERARGRRGRAADAVADRFLARQEELVAKQLHHLDEQFRHLRLKHFSERLKVTLQLLTTLVGVALLGGVGWMAWTASQDRSLVIDGFGAPADLAQQGTTGAALAGEVQDALARLHVQTVSAEQTAEVRERAAGEVKVEIPETGISIGELNQALREWLGHETHVRGELSRISGGPGAGGLALSVRAGAAPGQRFVRQDGDLEALVQAAAEYVYRTTEPWSYGNWLSQHGRTDDAIVMAQAMTRGGSRHDRLRAASWLSGLRDVSVSEAEHRATAADLARQGDEGSWNSLGIAELDLGHWAAAEQAWEKAAAVKPRAGTTAWGAQANRLNHAANLAGVRGDYRARLLQVCFTYDVTPCTSQGAADAMLAAQGQSDRESGVAQQLGLLGGTLAQLYETRLADRVLQGPFPAQAGRSPAYAARAQSYWIRARATLAEKREDWPQALRIADEWDALAASWPGLRYESAARLSRPLALAHLGRVEEAERLLAAMPPDCYPCLVWRGRVASFLGRHAEAQRWYAEALRQAPSLAYAEQRWAEDLLAQGAAAAAVDKATAALAKSPRYPDTKMVLGEALMAQGDAAGAISQFDELARISPGWGRLHLKWGEALAKQGGAAEARAQFAQAAGLDLIASERAELAQVTHG